MVCKQKQTKNVLCLWYNLERVAYVVVAAGFLSDYLGSFYDMSDAI